MNVVKEVVMKELMIELGFKAETRVDIIMNIIISTHNGVFEFGHLLNIRKCLELGADHRLLAMIHPNGKKPLWDTNVLRLVYKSLRLGVDYTKYMRIKPNGKPMFNHTQMVRYHGLIIKGFDPTQYVNMGYDVVESGEIVKVRHDGVDVIPYITTEFVRAQIEEIKLGLMAGVDVTTYNNVEYKASEMRERRIALERQGYPY
jgi:hypothetical protein